MTHPSPARVHFVRIAYALAAVGALASLGVACSSAPQTERATTEQQAATRTCTDPFTSYSCVQVAISGGGSGGIKPESLRPELSGFGEECGCNDVTGPPDGDNGVYSWETNGGLNIIAPPSSLAGCTVGLTFVNPEFGSVNVWACPASTTLPASIIGLSDPSVTECLDSAEGGVQSPSGSETCELIVSGTNINSTGVGNANSGWILVMDGIVPSGYGSIPGDTEDAGPHPKSNAACEGGCMIPFNPDPGGGGYIP